MLEYKNVRLFFTFCRCRLLVPELTNVVYGRSIANTSKFTQQCNVGALFSCNLLAATSQFSVLIHQKMQLTGWDNDN